MTYGQNMTIDHSLNGLDITRATLGLEWVVLENSNNPKLCNRPDADGSHGTAVGDER